MIPATTANNGLERNHWSTAIVVKICRSSGGIQLTCLDCPSDRAISGDTSRDRGRGSTDKAQPVETIPLRIGVRNHLGPEHHDDSVYQQQHGAVEKQCYRDSCQHAVQDPTRALRRSQRTHEHQHCDRGQCQHHCIRACLGGCPGNSGKHHESDADDNAESGTTRTSAPALPTLPSRFRLPAHSALAQRIPIPRKPETTSGSARNRAHGPHPRVRGLPASNEAIGPPSRPSPLRPTRTTDDRTTRHPRR